MIWAMVWAVAQEDPGRLLEIAPLYRVEIPDYPGAVATSPTGSALATPPPAGVRYRMEPEIREDGVGVWPASQAIDGMNVEAWHARGYRGGGVKVAVFDVGWFGAQADPAILGDVQTADCVAHPSCEAPIDTFRPASAGAGDHGYACATVVRSVAPDAELWLVRVGGFTTFENAAAWAIRHEIDVISMSLSFFNSSFYDGGGPFRDVVAQLVDAGVLLTTSAGNSARQHLEAPWRDVDGDGRLDFDGANAFFVELNGGGRRTIFVNWDEHNRCGDSDLDVVAYDDDGFIVGRAEAVQDPSGDNCDPVERIAIQADNDGVYRVEVMGRRVVGSFLNVDILAQAGSILGAMPEGSIVDPGNHAGTFTVGAVRGSNYLSANIESFSSRGPVRSGAIKPDIAGPNGLDTPLGGPESFFGTSASTPAVAGAVAVVLSSDPTLTPQDAAARLRAWAWRDLGARLDDPRWGAGKARLPVLDVDDGGLGCTRSAGSGGLAFAGLWVRARQRRRHASTNDDNLG